MHELTAFSLFKILHHKHSSSHSSWGFKSSNYFASKPSSKSHILMAPGSWPSKQTSMAPWSQILCPDTGRARVDHRYDVRSFPAQSPPGLGFKLLFYVLRYYVSFVVRRLLIPHRGFLLKVALCVCMCVSCDLDRIASHINGSWLWHKIGCPLRDLAELGFTFF